MTVTAKTLIAAKHAENSQTTQYTAAGCKTIIDKFTITNTSGSNATITVALVVSGGTAATSNTITSSKSVAPGESYVCPELVGHILEPGGFISTLAGTATALVIRASGREIT